MPEDRTAYCVTGCGRPAETSRPLAVTRDGDPIVDLVCRQCKERDDVTAHYVTLVDGTVWPVNVGDIEWTLRYGEPTKSDLLIAASVLNIYASLTDSSKRAPEAEAKLARARQAQRDAPV